MSDQDNGAPLPPVDTDAVENALGKAAEAVDDAVGSAARAVENAAASAAAGSATKPDVGKRVLAYLIDWVIAMVLWGILSPFSATLGSLVGAAYLLLRDGLDFEFMRGRSLGKRLMKLTVVRDDGGKMDLTTSAKRNWPLALSMLPLGLFWLVLAPIAAVIGLYEAYLVLTSTDGRRWGDKLAGTKPLETDE